MTTATTTSPLESYQQGRDSFLAVVLDAMSGLETSVLEFQHHHEGQVRASGSDLTETLREKERLEQVVGEQALELEASRSHVCTVPEFADFDDESAAEPAPVSVTETAAPAEAAEGSEDAALVIAELRASLAAEQGVSAGLRTELAAEKVATSELRAKLAENDREIDKLDDALDSADAKLQAATEAHALFVREAESTFDQRLAADLRIAETGVRREAVRIIEAIAADNPPLAEAAELFTIAFPAEAAPAGAQEHAAPAQTPAPVAAPAPVPGEDFFASIPAPELAEAPAAPQADAAPEWDEITPAPTAEAFFTADPAPEADAAPAPLTQVLLPAPAADDTILDPNFFDTPQPLDEPAGEPVQAPAPTEVPKPGYGLFGRKKESQNV